MKLIGIYAIQDTLALTLVGGLHLFRTDAPAVRFFSDVASQPETIIAKHLSDHQLLCLGELDEETGAITEAAPRVVLTGSAWYLSTAKE